MRIGHVCHSAWIGKASLSVQRVRCSLGTLWYGRGGVKAGGVDSWRSWADALILISIG